nr:xyloglucan galactosyltransferase XLT2-like [Ipomoea batatas]
MLSDFRSNSPSDHHLQPSPKPKSSYHFFRNSYNSFQSQIAAHPRFWLLSGFLFIQLLVVFFTRNSPLSFSSHAQVQLNVPPQTITLPAAVAQPPKDGGGERCEYGRVYVYDLPPMFNEDLALKNCTDLHPWLWQCGLNTNEGYGMRATELAEILPKKLAKAWYRTNQFSSEVIFHHRLLNYRCRTMEPESATVFYIPFYAGQAVGKYLWIDDIEKRDLRCNMMLKWVQNQTYWRKSNGSDHFLTIGRITWDFRRLMDAEQKWGSSLLNLPAMAKVTRFIIERAPWDAYDVGVPYPTGFHPSSASQLRQWQRFVLTRNRTSLFTFIGATRADIAGDFRTLLIQYCRNESDACRVIDCAVTQCSNGSSAIQSSFLSSDFCLQPKGDSMTRRSVFDCMIAGSVPVFFWKKTAYDQYQWFLPEDPETYSVFIDHDAVRNGTSIRGILEQYSKEDIRKMRQKVVEIIPKLVYARPKEGLPKVKDAFDIAVETFMKRIKEEKDWNEFVNDIEERR